MSGKLRSKGRALVLSGGGSRGAYQIGAWQALEEMGIGFDAVYGTSIGAINAALFAQGNRAVAEELWSRIRMDSVVRVDDPDFSIDHLVYNKRDIIPFLVENHDNLAMDITPLRSLIAQYIDEGRVRASGLRFGIMTVGIPNFRPVEIRLEDIKQGMLGEWVIASASCFPVFPIQTIEGRGYIDGGYADNMPVDMALSDGAQEVVAVDIHPVAVHPEYVNLPFMKCIQPLHDLGGFMDFEPRLLQRMRRLGYSDALKAYRRLDGIRYAFLPVSEADVADDARRFMRYVTAVDASFAPGFALINGNKDTAPLIRAIRREDPLREYTWKDVYLRGLELCAEAMGFREDAIYRADELTKLILNYVRTHTAGEGENDARASIVKQVVRLKGKGEPTAEICSLAAKDPDAAVAAIFLHCLDHR